MSKDHVHIPWISSAGAAPQVGSELGCRYQPGAVQM